MKLAVFDLENTLIFNEFLPELARLVGREEEVLTITQQGIDGRIEWSDGFARRARMLRGLSRERVQAAARDLRPVPGALGFIRDLKARGLRVVLVTGGPREVAEEAKKLFGADEAYSNEFLYNDGHLSGEVVIRVDPRSKGTIVEDLIRAHGARREDVIAFADGLMDAHLLGAAGVRVGINSRGKLQGVVDYEAQDFHDAYRWLVGGGHI